MSGVLDPIPIALAFSIDLPGTGDDAIANSDLRVSRTSLHGVGDLGVAMNA